MQRCDDVFLETESVVVNGETAFVEWRMGLKIKGIEFIYAQRRPGSASIQMERSGTTAIISISSAPRLLQCP